MSREPQLKTILQPLPKINNIKPLDLVSNTYDSFPPMKTPKLQETKLENINYIGLRNMPKYKPIKKIKKNKVDKNNKNNKKNNMNPLLRFFLIFLISLLLCSTIYTILLRINDYKN
jgi:hypothetical protein